MVKYVLSVSIRKECPRKIGSYKICTEFVRNSNKNLQRSGNVGANQHMPGNSNAFNGHLYDNLLKFFFETRMSCKFVQIKTCRGRVWKFRTSIFPARNRHGNDNGCVRLIMFLTDNYCTLCTRLLYCMRR